MDNSTTTSLLWQTLTPMSKKKAKLCLQENARSTPGLCRKLRHEIGVNLSNEVIISPTEEVLLEEKSIFFQQPYVTRISLDKKKVKNRQPVWLALASFPSTQVLNDSGRWCMLTQLLHEIHTSQCYPAETRRLGYVPVRNVYKSPTKYWCLTRSQYSGWEESFWGCCSGSEDIHCAHINSGKFSQR